MLALLPLDTCLRSSSDCSYLESPRSFDRSALEPYLPSSFSNWAVRNRSAILVQSDVKPSCVTAFEVEVQIPISSERKAHKAVMHVELFEGFKPVSFQEGCDCYNLASRVMALCGFALGDKIAEAVIEGRFAVSFRAPSSLFSRVLEVGVSKGVKDSSLMLPALVELSSIQADELLTGALYDRGLTKKTIQDYHFYIQAATDEPCEKAIKNTNNALERARKEGNKTLEADLARKLTILNTILECRKEIRELKEADFGAEVGEVFNEAFSSERTTKNRQMVVHFVPIKA